MERAQRRERVQARSLPQPRPLAQTDAVPARRGDTAPPAAQRQRPTPISQFILKTYSRCNLACTYCYLYAGPDRTWRDRPRAAAGDVLRRTAQRIAEHAAAHRLHDVAVVLHGGEPLLAGADRLAADIETIRRALPGDCTLHASVQTNATLLTTDGIRTLRDAGIRIGVSLDGGLAAHNRERVDHAGRPSWPAASAGLGLLAATAPDAYAGVLCVADLRHDPVEVYDSLLALRPPAIDLLLPHGNWTAPPPGLPARPEHPAPYGSWLTAIFDRWWDAPRRRTRIRLFEECVALLLGVPAATERLGLQPFTAVVVETDGSIEQVDSLKSAYEGAAATGLDVFRHSFDDALAHPGVAARQSGLAALSATCRACPLVGVCGGGHYAHRYRAPSGFGHPSVYCADLAHLIRHIAARLAAASAAGSATGAPGDAASATGTVAGRTGGALTGRVTRNPASDVPAGPPCAAGGAASAVSAVAAGAGRAVPVVPAVSDVPAGPPSAAGGAASAVSDVVTVAGRAASAAPAAAADIVTVAGRHAADAAPSAASAATGRADGVVTGSTTDTGPGIRPSPADVPREIHR